MIPERCPLKKTNFDGWSTEPATFNVEGRQMAGLIAGNVQTDLLVEEQLAQLEVTRQAIARICQQCNQEGCDPYMFNSGGFVSNVRVVNPDEEERRFLEAKITHPTQKLERIKK